jgi:hypothetical protein
MTGDSTAELGELLSVSGIADRGRRGLLEAAGTRTRSVDEADAGLRKERETLDALQRQGDDARRRRCRHHARAGRFSSR